MDHGEAQRSGAAPNVPSDVGARFRAHGSATTRVVVYVFMYVCREAAWTASHGRHGWRWWDDGHKGKEARCLTEATSPLELFSVRRRGSAFWLTAAAKRHSQTMNGARQIIDPDLALSPFVLPLYIAMQIDAKWMTHHYCSLQLRVVGVGTSGGTPPARRLREWVPPPWHNPLKGSRVCTSKLSMTDQQPEAIERLSMSQPVRSRAIVHACEGWSLLDKATAGHELAVAAGTMQDTTTHAAALHTCCSGTLGRRLCHPHPCGRGDLHTTGPLQWTTPTVRCSLAYH